MAMKRAATSAIRAFSSSGNSASIPSVLSRNLHVSYFIFVYHSYD